MNLFSHKSAIATSLSRIWHIGFYRFAQTMVRLIFGTTIRIRVSGREHLPRRGAYMLIGNHISHFDPEILASVIWRHINWVVALDMFATPIGDFFFRGIDSIPIDRQNSDRAAVREIVRRLKLGLPVGIFPEGGIRAGAESILGGQPLDPNVAALAQLGGNAPIIPCVVLGTDKLYARRNWWFRTTIDFHFGPAIQAPPDSGQGNRAIRDEWTRQAEAALRRLAGELRERYSLAPRDMPMTAQERWVEAEAIEKSLAKRD